jgi:hypothetical protein
MESVAPLCVAIAAWCSCVGALSAERVRPTGSPHRERAMWTCLALATLVCAGHVAFRTIPSFSPEFAWGAMWLLSEPRTASALLAGCAGLALGLGARTAAVGSARDPVGVSHSQSSAWWRWCGVSVRLAVAMLAIAAMADLLPYLVHTAWPEGAWVPQAFRERDPPLIVRLVNSATWPTMPANRAVTLIELVRLWPVALADIENWAGLLTWFATAAVGAASLWSARRGRASAFDFAVAQPELRRRWVVFSFAWFAALVSAMPLLALGSWVLRVEWIARLWIW